MEEISKEKAIDLITEAFKDALTKENTKSIHNGNIFSIHEEDMKRVDVMSKLFNIFTDVSMEDGICEIACDIETGGLDGKLYTSFKIA